MSEPGPPLATSTTSKQEKVIDRKAATKWLYSIFVDMSLVIDKLSAAANKTLPCLYRNRTDSPLSLFWFGPKVGNKWSNKCAFRCCFTPWGMNCTAHLPPVLSTSTTRRPWTIRWSARTGTALISNASYFRESFLLCVMNSLWRLMKNCLQRGRQGQERNEGLCHALVSYLISWTMIDYILAYWSIIPKLSVLASLGILFVILPQVDILDLICWSFDLRNLPLFFRSISSFEWWNILNVFYIWNIYWNYNMDLEPWHVIHQIYGTSKAEKKI